MKSGIILALAAYAIYAWGDGIIKGLGGQLSIFEIGFFTTFFAAIFLFFLKPEGEQWRGFWRMEQPWSVHARALSGLTGGVLGVYALTTIPLAEVYALIFLAPLFVTLLSIVILKEQVNRWRWAAVVAGFAGIMLVVRPGFRVRQLGHLAALLVALLAATIIISMRSLAQEKQTTMLGVLVGYCLVFTVLRGGNVVLRPARPQGSRHVGAGRRLHCRWPPPATARHAPQPGQRNRADALLADHLGRAHRATFFSEYPDWITVIGLAVVGGSGLLTLVREKKRLGTVRWNPLSRNRL